MLTVDIRRDRSELRTLIVPGLGGSGPSHWQSLWQEEYPHFERVVQRDWLHADLDRWARAIADTIDAYSGPVVLVAHGFGALASVRVAQTRFGRIAGAMLVASTDFAAAAELAAMRLGARWIMVASRDDPAMAFARARAWSAAWSTRFVDAGQLGSIDARSGVGDWPAGLRLLAQLQQDASASGASLRVPIAA